MPPTEEARRKQLCDHLGREALALRGAAGAAHQVLLPWLTPPPLDARPALRHALGADQPLKGPAPERAALGAGGVPGPARGAALPDARGAQGAEVVRPLAAAPRRRRGGGTGPTTGLVQRAPRRPRGGSVPHAPGRRGHGPPPQGTPCSSSAGSCPPPASSRRTSPPTSSGHGRPPTPTFRTSW